MKGESGLLRHLRHISRVPSVWGEAIRAGLGIRRRRHVVVSSAYLQWRNYTAYGTHNDGASGDDLVHYLHWRRQMRRLAKWENLA